MSSLMICSLHKGFRHGILDARTGAFPICIRSHIISRPQPGSDHWYEKVGLTVKEEVPWSDHFVLKTHLGVLFPLPV